MDPLDNQTSTPAPAPVQPVEPAPKKRSSIGGVIAIILILALIVIGAFYVWGERIAENGALSPEEEQMLEELESQDSSTETSSIESDLSAENPDDFDESFDEAYAELDAAFEAQ